MWQNHLTPNPEKDAQTNVNYEADPRWRAKPLTPAQVLVNDVRLEAWRRDRGPLLEIVERTASNLVPQESATTDASSHVRVSEAAKNPIEWQKFFKWEEEFGWLRHLRLTKYQEDLDDSLDFAKLRWIHCSFKDSNYLRGFLWALSDDLPSISETVSRLENTINQHARYSKHGKYFTPCSQILKPSSADTDKSLYPMLLVTPFLDWSVLGQAPSLRFQVDRREGFRSARSSVHLLRSVLQYFYRLEDTSDRENSQVFAKHKPWSAYNTSHIEYRQCFNVLVLTLLPSDIGTNRELDLKVRQWYGHYPTQLVVDEVWILVIDAMNVVTFSSNQTWKSRSPPLQLTSRITDVAFRGIRNAHFTSQQANNYTALTHALTCLSGAVGMLHRAFWGDLVLPAADRYAGWLSHLQYRLHRSPSTKLVMDLIACQEELNIVIHITQQQVQMIAGLQDRFNEIDGGGPPVKTGSPTSRQAISSEYTEQYSINNTQARATYGQLSSSALTDPVAQLLDSLQRELTDLIDLQKNTDRLVTRTIQLVNIRLEDHGKAILVFTVVTIIFLPLNFVSSFFGMNFKDIRNMRQTQWLFWAVALCVTVGVVGGSLFLAFSGGKIMENLVMWRDKRKELRLSSQTVSKQGAPHPAHQGFRVIGNPGPADTFNLMTDPMR